MDKEPPTPPSAGLKSHPEKQARIEREAAALRDNLRKRKAQTRARKDTDPLTPPPSPGSGERE